MAKIQYKHISDAIAAQFQRQGILPGAKLPSVREIAKEHGVSIFTISKALKQLETRGVIERRWGVGCFLTERGMRARQSKRTPTFGILLVPERPPSQNDSWTVNIMQGLLECIQKMGVVVKYVSWRPDLIPGAEADALIVPSQAVENEAGLHNPAMDEWLKNAALSGYPIVVVDCDAPQVSSVQIDNAGEEARAVRYLLDLGHRRIAYLGIPNTATSEERLAGLRSALAASGIQHEDDLVWITRPSVHTAYQKFPAYHSGRHFTAMCCFEDGSACGVVRAAREMGLRIPGDLSVVGFGNGSMGEFAVMPLTTIDIRPKELASRAVELLQETIESGTSQPTKIRVTGELIVRATTGPVATAK
jgi:DNA-binding LacI/PurR family transcriptional regulator